MNNYILLLSKKNVSLLKMNNNELKEVHDKNFPKVFQDDYEYARSSRGTSFGYSLKGFEKDKSISKKERFSHFLKEVNKNLKSYLRGNSTLTLTGTDQDRNEFKRVSDYNHLITNELAGSFSPKRLSQIKQSLSGTLVD